MSSPIFTGILFSLAMAISSRIPCAPHIYCTQFLNDDIPEEREMGIHIGNKILQSWCDELWVFGVRSIQDASAGMREEIAIARENSIPVKMGEDMLKR